MILIVTAQFNSQITQKLEDSAIAELNAQKIPYKIIKVEGAVEIPVTIQHFLQTKKFKAAIALGCVIKGGTDHYEMVLKSCTEGLTRLALDEKTPIIQGVLACHDFTQAWERKNLGKEYAKTAIKMIHLLKK